MAQNSVVPSDRSLVGDQLRVLKRRWKLIALVTLLALGASLAYSAVQEPQYRSTADILLSPTTFDVQRGGADIAPEEVATQVRVVTSRPVAELVRDDLRLEETPTLDDFVTVEALGNARVLRVTSRATDREDAEDLAESVAESYLSYRRTNTQQSLTEVASTLTERQQQLEDRIDRLDAALRDSQDRSGELEAERRNLLSQLGQITTQLAGLDISVAGGAGGDVLERPQGNTQQIAPRPVLNGVLALLIGLLAGVALAFTRDRFDDVSHDEDRLRASLGAVPVLATVPRWKVGRNDHLVTMSSPDSPSSQAFQSLLARLRYQLGQAPRAEGQGAVLMCTSAEPNEGKSDVAANIAVAAARVGMRVVLVDADLRRPGNEQLHGAPSSSAGLAEALSGTSLEQVLVAGPVDNIRILPAGSTPVNLTELVASPRMRELLAELSRRADLVIVDAAPVASYADALELAGVADTTLLVLRVGRSRTTSVGAAAERLGQVGASMLGAVLIGGGQSFGRGSRRPQTDLPQAATAVAAPPAQPRKQLVRSGRTPAE